VKETKGWAGQSAMTTHGSATLATESLQFAITPIAAKR